MNDSEALPDPLRRNAVWRFIQFFFQIFCAIWLRYQVRGRDFIPASGALILANHQSFLDPLLIGVHLTRPVSYLARDSLFRVPGIGWILRNTYVMSIRRESAGTESIRKSITRLQHGFLVGMFPEGTRSQDGMLGQLKPGFVALVRRSDVPIVPVGIAGAYQAMPKNSRFIWPSKVRVVFGEPISVETIKELSQKGRQDELLQLVQNRLTECHNDAEIWRVGKSPYSSID